MLSILRRLRPILPGETLPPPSLSHGRQAPQLPTFTVATYRGCQAGWETLRVCSDRASAERFAELTGKIRPDFITEVR